MSDPHGLDRGPCPDRADDTAPWLVPITYNEQPAPDDPGPTEQPPGDHGKPEPPTCVQKPRRRPLDRMVGFRPLCGTDPEGFDPETAEGRLLGGDPVDETNWDDPPWDVLWRTEHGRWVLYPHDGEPREVTPRKASWLLLQNDHELFGGLTPVLGDPDAGGGAEATTPRGQEDLSIEVDLASGLAKVNGVTVQLRPHEAIWLSLLAKAEGGWVSFEDAKETHAVLKPKVVTRVNAALEKKISALVGRIESEPWNGTKLLFHPLRKV
jgi:hypothetical protein